MSSVFGFSEFGKTVEKYGQQAEKAPEKVKKYADKMRDKAKSIASSKGLNKTGAGISGIQSEESGDGALVGWGPKPNFHLYFHEKGFHAKDNRGKKKRKRKSTYIPASPHMRPAFDELEPGFVDEIQKLFK